MKRFFLAVMAVLLLAPGLRAQDDAAKRAKVEELFTVMRMDQTMSRMMTAIRQQTEKMMQSIMQPSPGTSQMTPEQKRITQEFQNKVLTAATEAVGWKALEPDMVNLYASTYTPQEIDGLIAFYKSPVGQTFLDKTPDLTQASMQLTQQKVMALQPKMQALIQDYAKQIEAAGPPPPPPPPPPPHPPSKPQ